MIFTSRNSSIAHFMKGLQSIFVYIRSYPKDSSSINLLYIFEKYLLKVTELEDKEIAKLKEEINQSHFKNAEYIPYLISDLNVYEYELELNSLDKIINNIEALIEIIKNFKILYNNKEFDRIRDLADAVHNFPEMLTIETWSYEDYWRFYIKPYRVKWDKTFLDNWNNKPMKKGIFRKLNDYFMK